VYRGAELRGIRFRTSSLKFGCSFCSDLKVAAQKVISIRKKVKTIARLQHSPSRIPSPGVKHRYACGLVWIFIKIATHAMLNVHVYIYQKCAPPFLTQRSISLQWRGQQAEVSTWLFQRNPSVLMWCSELCMLEVSEHKLETAVLLVCCSRSLGPSLSFTHFHSLFETILTHRTATPPLR
jgi:hypothetical protein